MFPVPNISILAILIREGKSSQNAHWDPQNEFPGIPWIGLFLGIPIFLNRKP